MKGLSLRLAQLYDSTGIKAECGIFIKPMYLRGEWDCFLNILLANTLYPTFGLSELFISYHGHLSHKYFFIEGQRAKSKYGKDQKLKDLQFPCGLGIYPRLSPRHESFLL